MGNRTVHGMCHTPEYHAWESMRTRCHAGEESIHYDKYKARGIKVCEEWEQSFVAFYEHVGPRPSPEYTLDRVNNNGNYEPGNVRWATRREQQRNKRTTSMITINNVTRSARDWEEIAGLRYGALKNRLRQGWPTKDLLLPIGARTRWTECRD